MDYRNIVKTLYKVSDFLSWQRNNTLILSPSFQRRPVWKPSAKSYLMDTVVKGLPIPIIFIRERVDIQTLEPQREVVDGQQRLRTLFSFIDSSLLRDYNPYFDDFVVSRSHNSEIGGKKFSELDRRIKQKILEYEFSVHILPSDTDDREVLQIFARMNSTGVKLNRQELRNAEYFGVFKQMSYDLAYEQINRWRDWSIFSEENIARMREVEETSDLMQVILEGIHAKKQPVLDRLYKKYEEEFDKGPETARRFRIVMEKIDETIGKKLPTLEFSKMTLFNTLFSFFYDIIFGLNSPLEKKPALNVPTRAPEAIKIASDKIEKKQLSEELLKIIRGGVDNLESRKLRLNFVRNIYQID